MRKIAILLATILIGGCTVNNYGGAYGEQSGWGWIWWGNNGYYRGGSYHHHGGYRRSPFERIYGPGALKHDGDNSNLPGPPRRHRCDECHSMSLQQDEDEVI